MLLVATLGVLQFHGTQKLVSTGSQQVQAAVTFMHTNGTPDPNEIFRLVNQARQSAGLRALNTDGRLATVAKLRADDMATRHYYAHLNRDNLYYYDLMARVGLQTDYSCENLDMDFVRDALTYVNAWLNSTAGHRECLLDNRVSTAGYAVAQLSDPGPSDTPTFIVVAIHATQPLSK